MKLQLTKKQKFRLENYANMLLLSMLTGLFSGAVVTLYNVLAHIGEHESRQLFSLLLENPTFIPLLFVGLAAGGLVIGTFVRFVPMIRGSGIPQIEGAARGIIRFKWYVTLCSMFAASLACIFLGLSAGAEGPSLEIGGCAGSAVATTLKRNQMVKRLQIAAGSSAGLAVAFNAPITGMFFALEEAFRSFSPQVFICSAISVVIAVFTRGALAEIAALDINTGFVFSDFVYTRFSGVGFGYALLGSILTALLGVAFYYSVFATKKLFKKITFLKGVGKYIIPFTLAGAFGLITLYAMGGGSSFIQALATGGTGNIDITRVFGISLIASLIIILLFKFIAGVMAMGCGVPCGVFIPMLAIGAGTGAVLSVLFQSWGMDGAFSDYLIIICMAAFFTSVVKAPITGIVMVFELTGQFRNCVLALMGIAIGYLIGLLFRTEPIYEKCLNMYIEEEKLYEKVRKERVTVAIQPGSRADGGRVRAIIWPTNGLVVERILADGTSVVADGETILSAGEKIVFECETDDINELYDYLYDIVGKPDKQREKQ